MLVVCSNGVVYTHATGALRRALLVWWRGSVVNLWLIRLSEPIVIGTEIIRLYKRFNSIKISIHIFNYRSSLTFFQMPKRRRKTKYRSLLVRTPCYAIGSTSSVHKCSNVHIGSSCIARVLYAFRAQIPIVNVQATEYTIKTACHVLYAPCVSSLMEISQVTRWLV